MGWFWSGMTNARAGESATAIKHYERAIELESLTPQRSTVTGYLGTSRVMDGDFAGALPLLTEALRIRPGWTSLHIFSAIALSHLRRIDEARHALATAEMFAPIAEARWPTRDLRQQALLCDGLSKAGFEYPEQIFADV
jgi:tetratricopeptide (TPR) repeat protein